MIEINSNHFEDEENKRKRLLNELYSGERSKKIKNFDRNKNLERINAKFRK